jgi:cysteine desulfurase
MIYLDNAASTPLLAEVRAAMEPFLAATYGNASSAHREGRRARKALEDARESAAAALGAHPREIVFTSGATESNHLAILGAAEALRPRGNHVVTSAVEHPCVLEACRELERRGFRVTRLPVDGRGRVDPAEVARAVTPATVLVSVMTVNHETGTLQPLGEIREAARGALLHTDAAQATGKVPVDARGAADLLTFSAHKMHGPKGVGGLFVRKGVSLLPMLGGGGQEFERRAGTENVAGAAGLSAALRIAVRDLAPNARRMEALRERLKSGLEGIRVMGDPDSRAPHILSVSFEPLEGETMVAALDGEGVCVSTGSACASLSAEPSPVLRAMGLPPEAVRGAVRFSLSALTTEGEVDGALRTVARVVERLRRVSPVAR